jgi:cobalamin biosynthesis Co2+ chelatase CbiK
MMNNEILVVSVGNSYNESGLNDIKGIEDAIAKAYPDWSVRRAFTSQKIINHIKAKDDGVAFVFMGHGTSHTEKVSYSQMQTQMGELGYDNVFIGTVEGEPEQTACDVVIDTVAEAGYTKVVLRPLMVVAGDHANNDMAGDDEESWKSLFLASGKFEGVDTQISGLASIEAIRQIYVKAVAYKAMVSKFITDNATNINNTSENLPDATYSADFETDSSMFHVNEAYDGKGTLYIQNGEIKPLTSRLRL